MNAGNIKEFLATQDISWDGKYRRYKEGKEQVSWDADLEKPLEQTFLKVKIDGKEVYKNLLIVDKVFFIYDEKNEMPEKDLSWDWQVYQSIVEEQRWRAEREKSKLLNENTENIKEDI